MSGVSTLFVPANTLPATTSPDFIGGLEICKAMEKVVGVGNVDGSIRISGLWRLQVKNEKARSQLLTNGLPIRGINVTVVSKNPYLVDNEESVKLIVGNLPFSISNEEIKKSLETIGAKVVSSIKWEHYREVKDPSDPDKIPGLTSFKTGRRFTYIAKPSTPLPMNIKVANNFTAFLYYKGQKEAHAAANAAADAAAHRAKVFLAAAAAGRDRADRISYSAKDKALTHLRENDVVLDDTLSADSNSFNVADVLNSTTKEGDIKDSEVVNGNGPAEDAVINTAEENIPPAQPASDDSSQLESTSSTSSVHKSSNIMKKPEGLPFVQSILRGFTQRGRQPKKPFSSNSNSRSRSRSSSLGKRASSVERGGEKKKKESPKTSHAGDLSLTLQHSGSLVNNSFKLGGFGTLSNKFEEDIPT